MHEAKLTVSTILRGEITVADSIAAKKGEVVATDGKQLLIQRGFAFPWTDDVLVPKLSVFGSREVSSNAPVAIARTDKQVVVRVDPWTFCLTIDSDSRYPQVECVVPRTTSATTVLHVDEADADYLINILPKLPGSDDTNAPITLDLDQVPVVRANREDKDTPMEAALRLSRCTCKFGSLGPESPVPVACSPAGIS